MLSSCTKITHYYSTTLHTLPRLACGFFAVHSGLSMRLHEFPLHHFRTMHWITKYADHLLCFWGVVIIRQNLILWPLMTSSLPPDSCSELRLFWIQHALTLWFRFPCTFRVEKEARKNFLACVQHSLLSNPGLFLSHILLQSKCFLSEVLITLKKSWFFPSDNDL